eukprot:2278392-Amphidinium_carterae.1
MPTPHMHQGTSYSPPHSSPTNKGRSSLMHRVSLINFNNLLQNERHAPRRLDFVWFELLFISCRLSLNIA